MSQLFKFCFSTMYPTASFVFILFITCFASQVYSFCTDGLLSRGVWNFTFEDESLRNSGTDPTMEMSIHQGGEGKVVHQGERLGKVLRCKAPCLHYSHSPNSTMWKCADSPLPNNCESTTISTWIKVSKSTDMGFAPIITHTADDALEMYVEEQHLTCRYMSTSADVTIKRPFPEYNRWNHVTCVYHFAETNIQMFVNGELVDMMPSFEDIPGGAYSMGLFHIGSVSAFEFYVDDFVTYPYAINEEQAKELYRISSPKNNQ